MPDAPPPRAAVRAALALRGALLRAADAVVPPEVAVYEHAFGVARTAMLAAVAELRVPDALAAGPRTAGDLAGELGLDADHLHRVLRALAVMGIVRLDRRGRFRLTRAGRTLREDHDPSTGPWARYLGLRSTREAWAGVGDAIRTGRPAFPAVHGRSVWVHFAAHPEEERLFAAAMRNLSRFDARAIAAGGDWPAHGTLCDVAGGVGTVLAAVLARRPGLRGVLVDAPGVLTEADALLRREEVRDRVELVAGDIFDGMAVAADTYLLKDVLHDWDDAACATILRTVARAMPPGARVVLVERLQERHVPDRLTSFADVQMLTQCDGGRQRSAHELRALLRAAGLRPGGVRHTAGPSLVDAYASSSSSSS